MTMWRVLPEIVEPDLAAELVTITAMKVGSGPAGGGVLLPGSAVQPLPQVGVVGFSAKPLKLRGAEPPLKELSFAHCAPQKVTEVPVAAFRSPMTKLPPPGPNPTVQMTATGPDVVVNGGVAAFVTDACSVSVPGSKLEYEKLALPLVSVELEPLTPALSPELTVKVTNAPESGSPQLLVKVAVTVAVEPTE